MARRQRIVNEQEKEGLVAFKPNPHHRRANLIVLTNKSGEAYATADRRQIEWDNAINREFDVRDLETADTSIKLTFTA